MFGLPKINIPCPLQVVGCAAKNTACGISQIANAGANVVSDVLKPTSCPVINAVTDLTKIGCNGVAQVADANARLVTGLVSGVDLPGRSVNVSGPSVRLPDVSVKTDYQLNNDVGAKVLTGFFGPRQTNDSIETVNKVTYVSSAPSSSATKNGLTFSNVFTPNRVLVSDANGKATTSIVTANELETLSEINVSMKNLLRSVAAVPTGFIAAYYSANIPAGWLLCDGSVLQQSSEYLALIQYLGSNRLPDLRGVFIRGLDNGRNIDPGRTLGSLQNDEIKSHTHWCSGAPKDDNNSSGCGNNNQMYGLWADAPSYSVNDPNFSFGRNIAASGGNETRPVNVAVYYIIKI